MARVALVGRSERGSGLITVTVLMSAQVIEEEEKRMGCPGVELKPGRGRLAERGTGEAASPVDPTRDR